MKIDIIRKSQGPAALSFLIKQSYMTYKCENSQQNNHGLSSISEHFCKYAS